MKRSGRRLHAISRKPPQDQLNVLGEWLRNGQSDMPGAIETHSRWIASGIFVAVLVDGLVRLLPWRPLMISASIDCSWIRSIQEAFLHRWRFGTDIVFTYGPWGFSTQTGYHPNLWRWQLLLQGAVVSAVLCVAWKILAAVVHLGIGVSILFANRILWERAGSTSLRFWPNDALNLLTPAVSGRFDGSVASRA